LPLPVDAPAEEGGRVRKRRKRRRVFNRIEIEIERTTEDEIWAGGLLNDARRRAARVDARARGRAGGRSGRSTRTVGPDDGRELLERADDLMAFVRPASERGRDARARGGEISSASEAETRAEEEKRRRAAGGRRTHLKLSHSMRWIMPLLTTIAFSFPSGSDRGLDPRVDPRAIASERRGELWAPARESRRRDALARPRSPLLALLREPTARPPVRARDVCACACDASPVRARSSRGGLARRRVTRESRARELSK